jgi:ABC-type polysaccharide/polyol phosphate export permease
MTSTHHMLRTAPKGVVSEALLALDDVKRSVQRIGLAWSLAWHDVVARYRGSILGPFWITLSMGVMVLGIGLLYAQLFRLPVHDYMPFVAVGIVLWGLISTTLIESCDTYVQAAGMLRQTALPLFIFTWRTLFRNLINLAHHAVIIVAVVAVYGYWKVMNLPVALLGLALLIANVGWMSLVVSIAAARFRDVPQIVGSFMQFAVFMTPVFWKPDAIPERHAILLLNPFYYLLQSVRAPLLGEATADGTYLFLVILAVVGWTAAFGVFSVTRRRIVHYL